MVLHPAHARKAEGRAAEATTATAAATESDAAVREAVTVDGTVHGTLEIAEAAEAVADVPGFADGAALLARAQVAQAVAVVGTEAERVEIRQISQSGSRATSPLAPKGRNPAMIGSRKW